MGPEYCITLHCRCNSFSFNPNFFRTFLIAFSQEFLSPLFKCSLYLELSDFLRAWPSPLPLFTQFTTLFYIPVSLTYSNAFLFKLTYSSNTHLLQCKYTKHLQLFLPVLTSLASFPFYQFGIGKVPPNVYMSC